MTSRVAALYVDPHGVYANLPDVELWDETRDARSYDGPWPVVAHPPCARWCQLASVNETRWGTPIGDDGDTTRFARGKLNEFAADRVQPCALARGVPVGALCELDAVAGIR